MVVATSFEPIIQRSIRPFSKVASRAALAAQPRKITCPRSGNDKPCALDLAVPDDFHTLKHEGSLAPAQFSAESLHADEAGGFIVASDL
jgi:hypothetical protein